MGPYLRSTLLLLLLLLPLGCRPAAAPVLTYSVSPCQESIAPGDLATWAKVEAGYQGEAIVIHHNLDYVCCAEIELRLEREGSLLKIIETNTGEFCRCKCGFVVDAAVTGLPRGRYIVQVWGVAFEDQAPELLAEVVVEG